MAKGKKYNWGIFSAAMKDYGGGNPNYQEFRYKNVKKDKMFQSGLRQFYSNLRKELDTMSIYDAVNFFENISEWIEDHDKDFSVSKHPEKNFCDIGKIYSVKFGIGYKNELSNFHRGLCIGVMGDKIGIIPMKSAETHKGEIHDIFQSAYHKTENPDGDKRYYRALKSEGFPKDAILMIADTKFVSVGKVKECDDVVKISPYLFRDIQVQVLLRMMPELAGHYDYLERLGEAEKEKYHIVVSDNNIPLNQQNQEADDQPTSEP